MHIKRFLAICCVVMSMVLGTGACDQTAEAPPKPPSASPPTPTRSAPKAPAQAVAPPAMSAVSPPSPKVETPPVELVVEASASAPPTTAPPPTLDLPMQLKAAQAELAKAQAALEAVKNELLVSLRASKDYQSAAKTTADLEAEVKKLRSTGASDLGDKSLKLLGAKSDLAKMEKAALTKAKADPKYIAAEREVAKWLVIVADLKGQIARREAALLAQRQAEEAAALAKRKSEFTETAPRTFEQPSRGSGSVRSSGGSVQCSGTTQKGSRCRRMTTSASGRCYQH